MLCKIITMDGFIWGENEKFFRLFRQDPEKKKQLVSLEISCHGKTAPN